MSDAQARILIIDDDPLDREIFKGYLTEANAAGFCFWEVTTGRAGIEACAAFRPDCILLDYKLPDMDGLTIVRHLQNGTPGATAYPIVMLTALGNEEIAVEAMKLGVMDYVAKGPASAESLCRTVEHAIEKFQLQHEVARQRAALEQRNRDLELAQRNLLIEKERYRTLTEALPQLVWTAGADRRIRFANQHFTDYSGRSAGAALDDVVHEGDRERLRQAWAIAVENHSGVETEVRIGRASDGACRWHLLRAVAMADGLGDPNEWLGTLTDIEDQKRNEEVIRQKQKLESVGLLAGGIAHDFNNLLVGIMGGASYALQSIHKTHPAYEMLETVSRSSERAAHLVRQLLAYAGKAIAPLECVDLSQLVKDTSELVRATIPRPIQLIVDADPNLPKVETNEAQMQQLLINLIVNAAEAIGDAAGVVKVKASLREITAASGESNVLGYSLNPGQYAEIEVTDTGCGMDSETQARIFDPFFTTKFTGRGLGLAAVQGIVRSARGSISVTSAPGAGTTFRILLPVSKVDTVSPPSAGTEARAPSAARILLIDDEQIVRDVVTKALTPHGYTVLTAEDGQQGIQLLQREASSLSLVVLDQSMPGMSGVQVLEKIQQIAPHVPVVIASGYTEAEISQHFHGLVTAGFLAKPFTSAALVQKIGKILAEHRREL